MFAMGAILLLLSCFVDAVNVHLLIRRIRTGGGASPVAVLSLFLLLIGCALVVVGKWNPFRYNPGDVVERAAYQVAFKSMLVDYVYWVLLTGATHVAINYIFPPLLLRRLEKK